ncbi:MAG: hypothetical protein DPW18_04205 [Chloroflexi bacterium]|nr:hypothetical protein [Chloroflexota bacterium]MDL1941219.1 hypothetical protein [Chloroflexi bacterium CFX2]
MLLSEFHNGKLSYKWGVECTDSSGFAAFPGAVLVVGGAVFLIVLGGCLILKPYFDKQGLFDKAEQS